MPPNEMDPLLRNIAGMKREIERLKRVESIGDAVPGGGGGGVTLGNNIYLWPCDGGPIVQYAPNEAGLTTALSAAVTGDSVILPSIAIALTAGISVPAGVALVGISHNALLSFSGFSGTAITLSEGSLVEGFAVDMVSNGTTAIGINAEVADAVVSDMDVTASGGSTTNIAIGAGVTIVQDEIWVAGGNETTHADPFIVWSNYTRNGARVWESVASIPAGTLLEFVVADDGSAIYAMFELAPTQQAIYRCLNPKASSPTWTAIAYDGFDTGIGEIVTYFDYTLGPMTISGTTLITTASVAPGPHEWVYGEYNGHAWTWTSEANANMFRPPAVGFDSWCDSSLQLFDGNHNFIETFPFTTVGPSGEIWHRTGGYRYVKMAAAGRVILRIATVSSIDLGAWSGQMDLMTRVRGAHAGPQVYCVSGSDAGLYLSDDGTTFSNIATWAAGWIEDDRRAGGGNLIWIPISIANGATMGRQYDRAGNIVDDLTGTGASGFWTAAGATEKNIVGIGIVYV